MFDDPLGEAIEESLEEIIDKKPARKKNKIPDHVRAANGDTYVSIAAQFFPGDPEAAKRLLKLNNNKTIRTNVKVILK